MPDPRAWLEYTRQCKYLPEADFRSLCSLVSELLLEEPNVATVSSPVTVCGDIHGQFYDLEELFRSGGLPPDTHYIFLGDFVDRGYYSLETLTRLLVLKLLYPSRLVLLRGNHESRQITQAYGFYDECLSKYGGGGTVWRACCRVFDLMAVAAVIDGRVLCVHGGLSPDVNTIDQIRALFRNVEIPHRGALCDLVWSDPEDMDPCWAVSPRGAGWLFSSRVTKNFVHLNGLSLICRAHQLVQEGFKYMFDESLVTVWSAPNYCYRCGNVAAVLSFTAPDNVTPIIFNAVPNDQRVIPPKVVTPYFL